MILTLILSTIVCLITMALLLINSVISKKSFQDTEKLSPFECGFDPKSSSRVPFSLQFFLIAVIFLVFDVEIALLLPMILIMKMSSLTAYTLLFTFFIIVLIGGVYHEWNQGALNWAD